MLGINHKAKWKEHKRKGTREKKGKGTRGKKEKGTSVWGGQGGGI